MDLYDLLDGVEQLRSEQPVLMDVQRDLLERGREVYAKGFRRVIWQGPCGSGKTVIAAEQTRRSLALGKTVLHIVHRRRLVDQMIWTLGKFGIYASPIMEGRQRWQSPVSCASRDTLLAMLKADVDLPRADLLVIDECHVEAAGILRWYLANCPQAYWTGYTATPVRANGTSLKPPYQALVCMQGGPEELIRLQRLCDTKVFNPDAVGKRRRKGDKVVPVGDPVAHWLKYAKDQPTVAYAATVRDSQELMRQYRKAGISAEHMDASTPESEREAIFERSRLGETKVICNCNVLIEGVDLPWLVCCQILRGCNSLVLWYQATGRVMRHVEGKSHGIILDHAGAAHEYGLPTRNYDWCLDTERANLRKNKLPKDRKPVTCPGCGAVFMAKPKCPECGKVLPQKRRKSLLSSLGNGDGHLTEFNDNQQRQISQDTLARLFKKCYYVARGKGMTMGAVNAMFSREAKMPAWDANLPFRIPVGQEWKVSARDWRFDQ